MNHIMCNQLRYSFENRRMCLTVKSYFSFFNSGKAMNTRKTANPVFPSDHYRYVQNDVMPIFALTAEQCNISMGSL